MKNNVKDAAKWTKERFDEELEKGYVDMIAGRTRPASLVVSDIKKKFF